MVPCWNYNGLLGFHQILMPSLANTFLRSARTSIFWHSVRVAGLYFNYKTHNKRGRDNKIIIHKGKVACAQLRRLWERMYRSVFSLI
jgi:hypothetical protein